MNVQARMEQLLGGSFQVRFCKRNMIMYDWQNNQEEMYKQELMVYPKEVVSKESFIGNSHSD